MRRLTQAARVNLASVNYHFRSKEGLIEEVVRTYLEPIGHERLRLLEEARARHGAAAIPIRELVEMYLAPAVRALAERHPGVPSILSRLHHEPHPVVEAMILRLSQPIASLYAAEVQRALPHLDAARVLLRGHMMIGAMLFVLGSGRVLMRGMLPEGQLDFDAKTMLGELVAYCEAGFRANS